MAIKDILTALADDNRRNVLMKLKEGKISSGDLAEQLGMSPQALSYHLAKLKKADLIYETKYKNFIYYELNLSILDEALMWISELKGEKNENKKLFYVLMFLPLVASLIALQFLPNVIPAHYNINNVVDRWGSKYEILILPVLIIGFGIFSLVMGKIAQKQEPQGNNNEKSSLFISNCVLLIFNMLSGFMIYSSLHQLEKLEFAQFTFIQIVFIIMGIFLIVISNILPKVKRNSILGFRTKQTMKNDEIWKKCQRFSGLTGISAGFVIVVISFLFNNTILIIAVLIITFLKLGIDIIYSYKADC